MIHWRIVRMWLPAGLSVLLGCQAGGAPPLVAARAQVPQQAATSAPCVTAQPPDWVNRGASELRDGLHGIGESTVSQEDADSAARRDLVKQLEVTITGADETVQHESTASGFSYVVSSKVVEKVNLRIAGISVVARWADRTCGRYFSLVRLDLKQAVESWLRDLKDISEAVPVLRVQAIEQQRRGEIFEALASHYRVLAKLEEAVEIARRLDRLIASPRQNRPEASEAIQAQQVYDQILAALRVRRITGQEQRAVAGRPLEQPLVLEVMVRLPAGDVPLRDVPIGFGFQVGNGDIESVVRTDQQGRIQVVVPRVEFSDFSARIVARLAIEHMGVNFPEPLRRKLEQRAEQEAAVFMVLAPEEAIGSGIVDWGKRLIRVKGFGMANKAFPPQVWARSAEQAAKVDAQVKLLEMIEGPILESKTFVTNYQLNRDEKIKEIKGHLKGATQVGPAVHATDDTAEVVMEVKF
jgi:hypothetical protein